MATPKKPAQTQPEPPKSAPRKDPSGVVIRCSGATMRPVDGLAPYPKNARTHSPGQVAKIAASLKAFGWTNPVLVDKEGIIAGHGRVLAAQALGMPAVPCLDLAGLTKAQRRAYILADNKLALDAGWDDEVLAIELKELADDGFDLTLTGFGADEVSALSPMAPDKEEAVPSVPDKPTTRKGDVWILGKHRLLCGDSTVATDVDRVFDGVKADLCFTSPPYGAARAPVPVKKGGRERNGFYASHKDDPDRWSDLMDGWWAASAGHVSAWIVNVQMLAGNKRDLVKWIADRSDQLVDSAVWVKGNGVPCVAPGVFSSGFEFMLVFSGGGASRSIPFSSWQGTVSNVLSLSGNAGNEFADVHRAVMPVDVARWAIATVCDKARTVYDPFCGVGTTIIAAESTGRSCHAIELDPGYVDVAVIRWQNFSGQKATLDGRTFDDVKAERLR